ncbi:MAG: MATE family efflux transporter [Clostridia bacterium]|nr:MATE family efflux transporter [Clostridia bacterium]
MDNAAIKNKKGDLTGGSIGKSLIFFFIPILAGTWFQQLYNAVDAAIVGRFVGSEALAAVGGSAALILNLFIGFFIALSTGATVVISHIFGANEDGELGRATGTATAFSLLFGLVCGAVCFIFAPKMLEIMKTPAETMDDAVVYLRICFAVTPAVLMLNTESALLRAVGDSARPFIFMAIACVINIALDLLFIARFNWGVKGAALATVISQCVNCLLLTVTLFTTKQPYKLKLKNIRLHRDMLKRMMRIGLPSGLEASMYSVSNMVIQVAVNSLGTIVVASWSLSGKLDGFYWAMAQATNAAVMSFVGQNYGAGRHDRVHGCVKTGLKLFSIMTVVMSALIITTAPQALKLFTREAEVISTTYTLVLYFVPFYFIWTAIETLSGTLRGCGDTKPIIITGVGICLFRVFWVLVVYRLFPTLFCISISYVIAWSLTLAAMAVYYRRNARRQTGE